MSLVYRILVSVQFSSAQLSSRWYLCAREGPYALHPRFSGVSPNVAPWNSSNVGLVDGWPFLLLSSRKIVERLGYRLLTPGFKDLYDCLSIRYGRPPGHVHVVGYWFLLNLDLKRDQIGQWYQHLLTLCCHFFFNESNTEGTNFRSTFYVTVHVL